MARVVYIAAIPIPVVLVVGIFGILFGTLKMISEPNHLAEVNQFCSTEEQCVKLGYLEKRILGNKVLTVGARDAVRTGKPIRKRSLAYVQEWFDRRDRIGREER